MQYFGFDKPSFGIKTFGFGVNEFSPLDLFAGGKQGIWYDPSDKSTLFQDAAGTIPVTANGDPVGMMKDKSGNGNHAKQTLSASRPTYQTDGVLHWLAFDGVDDYLISFEANLITPLTTFSAVGFLGNEEYAVVQAAGALANVSGWGEYLTNDNKISAALRWGSNTSVETALIPSSKKVVYVSRYGIDVVGLVVNAGAETTTAHTLGPVQSSEPYSIAARVFGGSVGFYTTLDYYGGIILLIDSVINSHEVGVFLTTKAGITL